MKYFRVHNSHLTLWRSNLAKSSYLHLKYPVRISIASVLDILIHCSITTDLFLWKDKATNKHSQNYMPVLDPMVLN